jgi:hypothetical protein
MRDDVVIGSPCRFFANGIITCFGSKITNDIISINPLFERAFYIVVYFFRLKVFCGGNSWASNISGVF